MVAFPFPGVIKQSFTFRDKKGNTSVFRWHYNYNGADEATQAAFISAVQAVLVPTTNAALQGASGPISLGGVAQYGASGDYQDVIMKAVLNFQDASGQIHRFQLPSPKVTMFLADRMTLDPANATLKAFTDLFGLNAAPASGTPYVSTRTGVLMANFMGGYFAAKPIRRRSNIFVLTPQETATIPEE